MLAREPMVNNRDLSIHIEITHCVPKSSRAWVELSFQVYTYTKISMGVMGKAHAYCAGSLGLIPINGMVTKCICAIFR